MQVDFVAHPRSAVRIGDFLREGLANEAWSEFRASVAFVKRSGTKHVREPLAAFCGRGGNAKISAGIDAGGTSQEGLADLLEALGTVGQLFIYKNAASSTFHPKIYLFRNAAKAEVAVGSCNLTEGGLFTNYEASFVLRLDLSIPDHAALLDEVIKSLDEWSAPAEGLCYQLDTTLLAKLVAEGLVPDEVRARAEEKRDEEEDRAEKSGLFKRHSVPAAPKVAAKKVPAPAEPPSVAVEEPDDESQDDDSSVVEVPSPVPAQDGHYKVFLLTLQQTDVGTGEKTPGAQRRSPEIFIPLAARDADPEFWGWPDLFEDDPTWTGDVDGDGHGKMDRKNIKARMGGEIFTTRIFYYPDRREFRMRSENIRSAGAVGDILYVERADGTDGFSYYINVIPKSSIEHPKYLALCTNKVRNSKKLFGYY